MKQQVCILGATGSIGQSTLKVLAQHPERYAVYALSAQHRMSALVELCRKYQPKRVAIPQVQMAEFCQLMSASAIALPDIVSDEAGLIAIAEDAQVDVVMAAIVGAAGLMPTIAAVKSGKRVLLANKEALVMSGDLLLNHATQSGAVVLPVDSEHNAIFQCLPSDYLSSAMNGGQPKLGVTRLLLTASGGPFLHTAASELRHVTPAQACKHPNWSMGQKISVDSATLMNKGLELIEACHLFGLDEQFVNVVIHPQSIIHSMVQYIDGSTLAQMGHPDMCTPIAHALAWPERIVSGVADLNIFDVARLEFFEPDLERFPALNYARHAMNSGGTAATILNAANEIAVAAFLRGQIGFVSIMQIVEATLNRLAPVKADSIEMILHADQMARHVAEQLLPHHIQSGAYSS